MAKPSSAKLIGEALLSESGEAHWRSSPRRIRRSSLAKPSTRSIKCWGTHHRQSLRLGPTFRTLVRFRTFLMKVVRKQIWPKMGTKQLRLASKSKNMAFFGLLKLKHISPPTKICVSGGQGCAGGPRGGVFSHIFGQIWAKMGTEQLRLAS